MKPALTTALGLLLATTAAMTAGPPGVSGPDMGAARVAAAPQQAVTGPAAELVNGLEEAIAAPGWDGERWGVLVVSLDGGDTLFAHRAEVAAIPASNMKLFTTAAALYFLGSDYRYSTYLTGTGPIRRGVLEGDLYVYGTGDPTLSDRFFESKTAVWESLADSLAALGVERIAGDLVGDASYFEGAAVGRGWQRAYVTHTYAAAASALSYNDNVVTMRILPGAEVGAPPRIQMIPGGEAQVRNEATTTGSGRSWIEVDRTGYDAPIVVRGEIRQGASAVWRAVPVVDPAGFAVSVLAEILRDRGIRVDGRILSKYDAGSSVITGQRAFAPTFDEDPVIQVLAVHRSPPLQEILEVVNQRSHNLYAETVLRSVGRVAAGQGSVRGGEAAVLAILEAAGSAAGSLSMDDGSGLSPLDRASPRAIVELLAFMAASPYRDAYLATLPEAATSRGLRRMHQTPAAGNLRAKTGTIDRVSALSGYVRAQNGELLAFAILANDVPSTWQAKRVEDRIGARLASFQRPQPQRLAEEDPAPRDPTRAADAPRARADSVLTARETARDTAAARDTASAEEAEPSFYVIKPGDTLEGIARATETTVAGLREANPGVNARRLVPGQSLRLPGPAEADEDPGGR